MILRSSRTLGQIELSSWWILRTKISTTLISIWKKIVGGISHFSKKERHWIPVIVLESLRFHMVMMRWKNFLMVVGVEVITHSGGVVVMMTSTSTPISWSGYRRWLLQWTPSQRHHLRWGRFQDFLDYQPVLAVQWDRRHMLSVFDLKPEDHFRGKWGGSVQFPPTSLIWT